MVHSGKNDLGQFYPVCTVLYILLYRKAPMFLFKFVFPFFLFEQAKIRKKNPECCTPNNGSLIWETSRTPQLLYTEMRHTLSLTLKLL